MRRLIARRALKRVNDIRRNLRLEPIEVLPVGNRGQAGSCVLANALPGGSVGQVIGVQGRYYPHSPASYIFIRMFDMGLYPAFNSVGYWRATEGKRRRMCETRFQTIQRKRAQKHDKAAKEIVTQLRESEEQTYRIRQQLEAALAREEKAKNDIATERKISERLEKRLADQRRESAQRIAELEHESIPSAPESKPEPLVDELDPVS